MHGWMYVFPVLLLPYVPEHEQLLCEAIKVGGIHLIGLLGWIRRVAGGKEEVVTKLESCSKSCLLFVRADAPSRAGQGSEMGDVFPHYDETAHNGRASKGL
jgi:hypothetical protein